MPRARSSGGRFARVVRRMTGTDPQAARLPRGQLDPGTITSLGTLEPIRVQAKFFFEGAKKFFVKGVTYGPFKPDADGNYLPPPARVEEDFRLMRGIGDQSPAHLPCSARLVS